MKILWMGVFLAGVAWMDGRAMGQTHKVETPQTVVRAVGVYEWTGSMSKPTASRLVPVSLFIEGQLQDAGVYLARPVPFALLNGNVYELEQAGVPKGTLDLVYARHFNALDAAGGSLYDDGWFGYGAYKAPRAPKKVVALRASKTLPVIQGGKDGDRPHFAGKGGDAKGGDASSDADAGAVAADPDRPVLIRRGSGGSSGSAGSGGSDSSVDSSVPADDPDRPVLKKGKTSSSDASPEDAGGSGSGDDANRPTMQRRDSDASSDAGSGSSGTASGSVPSDDPDRPTLKRRSPEEARQVQSREDDMASEAAVASLNNDPNRPNLHRGKPVSAMTEADLPKLTGLPKDVDLQQMVAVSDAANRPVHDFARPWENDAERVSVLGKMEVLARAQLAGYVAKTGVVGTAPVTAAPAAAPAGKTPTTAAARRAAARKAKAAQAAAAAPVALQDEVLKGYLLSYGGLPTYVFTARTAGAGGPVEYVTVVAQADAMGTLKPAIQSVTDAAHLDRTARMRLVDAVDAEASNRASLLFELRGQQSRQFALYRVIGEQAQQSFVTGTTQ
jgi:hypothetical protein